MHIYTQNTNARPLSFCTSSCSLFIHLGQEERRKSWLLHWVDFTVQTVAFRQLNPAAGNLTRLVSTWLDCVTTLPIFCCCFSKIPHFSRSFKLCVSKDQFAVPSNDWNGPNSTGQYRMITSLKSVCVLFQSEFHQNQPPFPNLTAWTCFQHVRQRAAASVWAAQKWHVWTNWLYGNKNLQRRLNQSDQWNLQARRFLVCPPR